MKQLSFFSPEKTLTIILYLLLIISFISYRCTSDKSPEVKIKVSEDSISEWREENRTGNSSETDLLEIWPENGPELIWSNKDLPKGYSSVSFGENSIFLTGNNDTSDILVCLDHKGKIRWKTPYGRSWTGPSPESRCTPTVDGNRVYVSSGYGDLACIDSKSGNIVWSLKASEVYKGTYGEWGIAESLIIYKEMVFYTPGGPVTTTIALDKYNGKLIWKSPSINDSPSYVSPLLIDYQGKSYIVNISLRYVFMVDIVAGEIMWKINHVDSLNPETNRNIWPDAPLIKCTTPLYDNGEIFITGGYDHGSMMLKLSDNGKNAFIKWKDSTLDVHHGGVVLVNGYIYGSNWISNSTGNWCCLNWNTGEKMYEEDWKCKGSIISAGNMLYVYDEKNGNTGLVKANPEKFEVVSSFRAELGTGPYWAHPAINNGNLYLRHGEALMVYNIKSKL